MKIRYLLLGILLLASILRFVNIGHVPYGLSNDESSYIYSAYSLWKTGKGIDGTFLPISFNTDSSNSPVPVYITAPFVGLLGVSAETGRLPFILFGIGSVLVLYLLTKQLFDKEFIALASAFVLSVSPWHLHVTRTAYDSVFAMFFFLLGTYLFVKGVKKGKSVLWSLIPFFLAFYSYHATKFIFIFLLPVLVILFYSKLRQQKKTTVLFLGGYFLILITFFFSLSITGVTRQDETLLSLKDERASSTVNYERRYNEAPDVFRNIFNNKPAYFFRVVRENYLEAFSTNFLFLYGDTTSSAMTLGVLSRGVMYLVELPLLLLGLYYLFKSGPKIARNVTLAGLLIAPLASTFVSGKSYVLRDLNMAPFLSLIVGCGIYAGFLLIKKYPLNVRRLLVVGFFSIYCIFVLSYLYQYHFRYSVYGAQAWFRDSREVTELVASKNKESDPVYFFAPGKIMLAQYGIYGKIEPSEIQRAWDTREPKIENVTFLDKCPDLLERSLENNESSVYILPADSCGQNVSPVKTIYDYGESQRPLWNIYEI